MSESGFTEQQEQQIIDQFSKLQQEYNNFASTVARIELEVRDHSSVLSALKELDGDRKCFRVVGGVLVERTIKEVIPAVEGNMENLESTEKKLKQDLEDKELELFAYKEKYKIKFKHEAIAETERKSTGKSSGVLA